jgi:hypothetical protein
MVTLIKGSSLQKVVSKFTPKKFYEIDTWLLITNIVLPVIRGRICKTFFQLANGPNKLECFSLVVLSSLT